ncbi:MAG: bifunctional diaminohydroxyphosphoribosylaminopyrimidine deaminase/5-amino-6-(5-phosphoribosylamino)uracil reductase RibD [Pseudomonadota bacterium]
MSDDVQYMRNALALARTGLGRTWPNPVVGCVLVKDGHVVARARTADGGRPHAENLTLQKVGENAKGVTAYVTLEPCAHEGETPSCARLLIEAGVKRVVIAVLDPDMRTNGQGMSLLQQAGVEVFSGVLEQEAFELNEGFFLHQLKQRPFITLKTATTADGKIATATGQSKWITGEQARVRGHILRAQHDAIAVGVNTILEDDPSLTCRLEGANKFLVRIVFDTHGKLTGAEKIFDDVKNNPVWIITTAKELNIVGVKILQVSKNEAGYIDIKEALQAITAEGITRLLVEGGATLMTSFLKEKLFDELHWFRAPSLIGADGLSAAQEMNITDMRDVGTLALKETLSLAKDQLDIYKRA